MKQRINREHFIPHQVSHGFKDGKAHVAAPQRSVFYASLCVHQKTYANISKDRLVIFLMT